MVTVLKIITILAYFAKHMVKSKNKILNVIY